MQFEQALRVWGAERLSTNRRTIDPDTVTVEMEFNEGYACCGGTNPNCYCSLAEYPSAYVVISSGIHKEYIAQEDFDFTEVLGEIVRAGNGNLTE